jgi:Ca-activated chloride channel family protein
MNPRSPAIIHRRPLLLLAVLLTLSPLQAQRMELADTQAKAVAVESATITTEVTGRIAVTTFDLVFHNPNSRVLEGTLVFPLLEGQSVIRFALDINGALREAVPVDKTRGRIVFEEIERRGVDPGLLEQVAGNNYRARIYPIPANGSRRVVLAYQENLTLDAGSPAYRLNLAFPGKLSNFHFALSAVSGGGAPPHVRTSLPLELPAWRDGKFLEIERTDFAARGLIELSLPPMERPVVITGRFGESEYFYAEASVTGTARPRPVPQIIGLLWDSSGSGRSRDHDREFALLDAWFAIVKNVDVRLIRLRNQTEAPLTFTVKNGRWAALKEELAATVYDGATSLDGLSDDPAVQEWLLFSDGLINYGVTSPTARLPLKGAVHGVLSGPGADPAWLQSTAFHHGGEFVNLLATAPAIAAARLRSASLRVLDVEYDPEAVAQVFPETGTPVIEGHVVVTGMLRRPEATLRLRIGQDPKDAKNITILKLTSGENPSRLAPRAWAATKITHLSLDPVANREDIRRTSRTFGIVTADTSLLVLETVADYVTYDIAPPPELRAEWEAKRQAGTTARLKTDSEHLEAIVAAYQNKVAWWEQSYPKDTPPTPTENKKAREWATGGASAQPALAPATRADATLAAPSPSSLAEDSVTLSAFSVSADAASARVRGQAASVAAPGESTSGEDSGPAITLQPWSPRAGYLDHLRRTPAGKAYQVYLEERTDHDHQPGFFLDAANYFFELGDQSGAFRILSNLAELELEDVALLRVLAHRLTQADRPDLARPLFERVLILRPDEPQSYRDLALVCATLGQYQRAVDLLAEVATKSWNSNYQDIELIALTELNALAATCGKTLDLSRIDPRLRKNLPVATRVILTWDANECDIDLWVKDPNGEVALYSNPLTYQGGRMSHDFTNGYGPEEFMLRDPKPGVYQVQINYYGDRRQSGLGPVTAQVRLIADFGTSKQTEKRLTVRLQDNKETLDIGSFVVPGRN